MRIPALVLVLCAALGCSHHAYTNRPLPPASRKGDTPLRATLDIQADRGNPKVLVLLAISGGGSRAAYFAGSTMLAMETLFPDVNLLHEVDAISAVSGGCLPAAYYCASEDPGVRGKERSLEELMAELRAKLKLLREQEETDATKEATTKGEAALRRAKSAAQQKPAPSARVWDDATVKALMSWNYIGPWGRKILWPHTWSLFLCTAYDRSDMMAEVLSDTLFDFGVTRLGRDLTFQDLNPSRPYLILNATDGTANTDDETSFSTIFTFTDDDFRARLGSDIQSYEIGRAAMASAAFPGVFNYMTLRDFRPASSAGPDPAPGARYMHVFDGGSVDNLGLETVKKLVIRYHRQYRNIVVLAIDAHRAPGGVPRDVYDARDFIDYAFDSNIMDMYDSMQEGQRRRILDQFRKRILYDESLDAPLDLSDTMLFYEVSFDNVGDAGLRSRLMQIPTNFKITRENVALIDQAIPKVLDPDDPILRAIQKVLLHTGPESPSLRAFGFNRGRAAER